MITSLIISKLKRARIELSRGIDHFWRLVTGLPLAQYSEITPQLYVGGQYGLHAVSTMKKLGITAIVNMRTSPLPPAMASKGFATLHLPTPNFHPPKIADLEKGIVFIDQQLAQGGKVYVHCQLGEGRGPSMAIAYLISTGLSLLDAIETVRKVRPFIDLTKAQAQQLEKLSEKYNKD